MLAPLVAGCGGGDSTESTPTTTATTAALTKAQLIEQGDAICAEVNAAVGSAEGSTESATSPAAQAAGLYGGMVASLKNLGAPQESEGYPEFIAAAEALATAEDEVKLASERGDAAGLETAEANASSALVSFQAAADEYGFEKCGEGPTPLSSASGESESGGAEVPETVEPEAEEAPEAVEEAPGVAPETGGGTGGGGAAGGGTGGGSSGGVGPG